jgi:hypothetical protein
MNFTNYRKELNAFTEKKLKAEIEIKKILSELGSPPEYSNFEYITPDNLWLFRSKYNEKSNIVEIRILENKGITLQPNDTDWYLYTSFQIPLEQLDILQNIINFYK